MPAPAWTTYPGLHAPMCVVCCVDDGLALWGWGNNDDYQLGLGDQVERDSPTQVGTDTTWRDLRAGNRTGLALRTTSDLWSWGSSTPGQLGNGLPGTTTVFVPTLAQPDTDWAFLATGNEHALAIKDDGTLWTWGSNSNGQLGNGGTGVDEFAPIQIGVDTDWAWVAGGGAHSFAIKSDGTLWAWGFNSNGQLGLGDLVDRDTPTQVGVATNWATVALISLSSIAIKTTGTLWSCGQNDVGQLGLGDNTDRDAFVQVGVSTDWSILAKSGGEANNKHVLAIKTDDTLWSWGWNIFGELGLGDSTDRDTPTQVGADADWAKVATGGLHTLAIKSNGTLWSFGYNGNGQLGLGDTANRDSPTQVGAATTWSEVAAGAQFSLGLKPT